MTIERGMTQDFRITLRGVDLSEASVYVTFKQGNLTLTKHETISVSYEDRKSTILVSLSQEETLAFREGQKGECQLRWRYGNGTTGKSVIKPFDVGRVLYEAVLSGEEI